MRSAPARLSRGSEPEESVARVSDNQSRLQTDRAKQRSERSAERDPPGLADAEQAGSERGGSPEPAARQADRRADHLPARVGALHRELAVGLGTGAHAFAEPEADAGGWPKLEHVAATGEHVFFDRTEVDAREPRLRLIGRDDVELGSEPEP